MRIKHLFIAILLFLMASALFPAMAMAQEVSEQINVSGWHEVVESDRFKITSNDVSSGGMCIDPDSQIVIEAKKNHTITKVELTVSTSKNLAIDQIMPSRGAVSGNSAVGGSVVISEIYAPGVEIKVLPDAGYLRADKVTIYYEDKTVASYKNTTTAVHFNGMEWYVIEPYTDETEAAYLLSKDCIDVCEFNPAETNYYYKNSSLETFVMNYYKANFSAVDSAVINVTPGRWGFYHEYFPEGNEAKLWVLNTNEADRVPAAVRKCTEIPGNTWWLRDGGIGQYQAYGVECSTGSIYHSYNIANRNGVRPALKLNLTKVYFVDETKTIRLKEEHISQAGLSLTAESDEAVNIGDAMKLTATIEPIDAANRKIQWSTSGLEVELYTDEACQNPLPVGPTATRTVYAKGMKAGSVTVTVTSNEDSTISASCDLTVKSVPVGGVTLSAPVDMATGGVKKLTAGIIPENATDKTVLWSVGGENANAVKLYADETCTIEVGAEATSVRTVYARAISAGVTTVNANVTVTTNEDRTKTLSQPVTMEAVATVTAGGSTTIYFDYAEALAALNAAEGEATMQLLADVETKATTTIGAAGGTRVLDLNSHALKLTDKGSVLSVADGATLKLTDTSEAKTGSVMGGNAYSEMTSGVDEGAGVYVSHGGTFILEGGTITGNQAEMEAGGVYSEGSFEMTGGTISGNKSNVGAGVFSSGTFTMSGGTISGNQAEGEGGGVYIKDGTFTMSGGTISGNEAIHGGGGVLIDEGGTFTMSGGSITQNTAEMEAGGVFVNEGGTFRISGAPVITGNTSGTGNSASNAFLVNEQRIILDGAMSEGASIGVTMMLSDEAMKFTPNSGVFTIGLPGKGSTGNFTSDDVAYTVTLLDDEAALMDSSATRSVTITAGDHMTKTGDSGEATQTGLSGAMTDVVYTADEGYYFPEDYSVHTVHGISVTRDSFTQITVSGTPTADAAVTLPAPTAKTKPDVPSTAMTEDCTTADNNDGKITGVTTEMEYKKSDADDWTDVTGSDITGLVPGTYYVRVKATDTTFASDNRELTIRGRVAMPVFTPAAGSFIGTQRVEITCPTEDATIYYTTDGSEPTSGSTAYTGVIRISADTTFRAVAVKEGMRDSVIAEAAYTIAKPTYTLSVSAPAFEDAIVGYTQPEAQAIAITSSGNSDALISSVTLSGDQADSFTLQKGTVSVPAGGTNTSYTIRPGADLPEGIYMAAISVTYNNSAVATADVRFRVNADPTSGIGVGSTWYVGDSICLSGKWFVRSDSTHEAVRGDYHTNTVPNPSNLYLHEVPYWFFDTAVSVTDGGNPSLLLAVPNGRTVSDVPTGFRIRGGSGTEEDPFTFEPVYDDRPFISVTGVTLSPSAAQSVTVGGHVALTATVSPEDAADTKVKWSVGGPKAGAVTLYFDEACTAGNEVGTEATDTLTVYARGMSTGRVTVTVTSNADSTRSASCDVTVKEYYPIWVGGTQVTSENAGNIDGENKASYNPETKTLTLNNYSYTGPGYSNGTTRSYSAIRAEQPLTIELKGDNTLTHTSSGTAEEISSYGVFVYDADLTITGSGTLTARSGDALLASGGVWVSGSGYTLTIDSGATVKASSGHGAESVGAGAWDSVFVHGTLEATAGSGNSSYGVEADNGSLLIYTDGSVTAKGQTSALNAPYTVLPVGQRAEESANIDGSGAIAVAAGSNTATGAKYAKIWPDTHRHSFLYTADGATIYATCAADDCTLADREVTLTLAAPTLTYPGQTGDGIIASATLTGLEAFNAATGLHVAETDIQYYTAEEAEAGGQSTTRPGYRLDQAPTDLGEYCAVLMLTNRKISETETGDVQAMVSYTIAPPPLTPVTITAADQEVTYSAEGIVLPMEGMFTFSEGAGEATYDVTADTGAGTWDAQTGRLSVTACGTFLVKVRTAPTDTHAAAESSATLTVNKAEVTVPSIAAKTYNAQAQKADIAESALYTVTTNNGGTTVGNYDVVLTLTDSANYRWTDSEEAVRTLTFQITKATAPAVIVPAPDAVTYDPEKTLADVALTDGWAWVTAATVPAVGNEGYDAALTVDDTNYDYTGVEGYNAETHKVTRTVALTVNQAAPTVTGPTARTLTYTGSGQELVNAGSATGGTMYYALGTDGTTMPAEDQFTETIPAGTDAGAYYVWYRVVGDRNHLNTDPKLITAEIGKAEITKVKLERSIIRYTGEELTAEVAEVKAGNLTVPAEAYAISGNHAVDEGKYTVTVTADEKSNYTGTAAADFHVVKPGNKYVEISLPEDTFVYTGKEIRPAVNVIDVDSGEPLSAGLYNVSYSDNTKSGYGKVTVTCAEGCTLIGGGLTEVHTFTIQKAPLTVTAKDQTINEGDPIASGTDQVTAAGLLSGHSLKEISVTAGAGDTAGKVVAGEATIIDESNLDVTANYDVTYVPGKLTVRKAIRFTVTFKVVNGSWNEGEGEAATADKTVTLTGYEGDTLKLTADQIPAVGSRPDAGYKAGSWDAAPNTETAITGPATYTYTYVKKEAITPTVSITGWTYGESANTPSVTGNTGNGTVTYTYAMKGDTAFSETVPTAAVSIR